MPGRKKARGLIYERGYGNDADFNEVIWKAAKGWLPMPPAVHAAFFMASDNDD